MASDLKPVYLIAGGPSSKARSGPDPLLQGALRLASVDAPSVAYIGTASGDSMPFRLMIERLLRRAGAGNIALVPLCGARANSQKARRIIEECHIVFLSGGDVEAGMKVLEKHDMTDFLRDQYGKGKPFFGVSAGSIMLAKNWVRWRDPEVDSSTELFPCLGIADVYCDTHGEADDWEELVSLSHLIPDGSISYGITSGSALIAHADGPARAPALVRALAGEVRRFTLDRGIVKRIPSLFPIADS
jgi:putative intracellular protease/amidase